MSLFAFMASAQAPQAFKHQTVVRDAAGQVQANQSVIVSIDLEQYGQFVYGEDHPATSNAFGLVNLEIGRGIPLDTTISFNSVDWTIPTYVHIYLSIKGTAIQDMGTSELLSVPYAFYAANSGSSDLPANPQVGDMVYYNGASWQGLEAGAVGTVLTMGANGLPFWKGPSSPQLARLLKVTMTNGDVIYAHPADNSTGVEWGGLFIAIAALPNIMPLDVANKDFNGASNTTAIVTQLGDNGGIAYAAKLCADRVAYGFDDWYLPAVGELNEMYKKLGPVAKGGSGQITKGSYWSSSQYFVTVAWDQDFGDGFQKGDSKNRTLLCRCVRR